MIEYAIAILAVLLGLYTAAFKNNLIKKVLGLSIISNGIHLFLVSLGYRAGGAIPVLSDMDTSAFAQAAVDPLPQAFVLTSIVINLSITAVALTIIILVYRSFGTLDARKIRELRG
jgi:multicomponent Na+:H+ antiporter subunit C